MISVTKEYSWAMAHMLAEHPGLCKNIHGHNYKMEVTISKIDIEHEGYADGENSFKITGMVMDFKDLKKIVQEKLVDKLDHAFMYNQFSTDDVELEVASILENHGKKTYKVNYRPTAENMAKDFYKILDMHMPIGTNVTRIKIYETDTSYAVFE